MYLPPRPASSKPRAPLAEKGQQMGCMLATETFFRGEKTCPFRVSVKSLESPMKKDILKILDYLCNRLRPGLTEGFDLEHQMTDFLEKELLYPFEFPKTAFQIISNPNTYPHVLALISFLIQEIRKSEELKQAAMPDPASLAPIFQAYAAWLAERADKEQKAIGNLMHKEFSDMHRLSAELETLEVSNAALTSEIEELQNFSSKISDAAETVARLQAEERSLKTENDRKSEKLKFVTQQLNQLETSKQEKTSNFGNLKEKTKQLLKTNPHLSRVRVAELRKSLDAKKAEIDHLASISRQRNSDLRAAEQSLTQTQQTLVNGVAEFNRKSQVGKIELQANAASVAEMLKFPGDDALLVSLAKKMADRESEISALARVIENRKTEISRVAQTLQGAASAEGELKKTLEKIKRETSDIDAQRKTLDASNHASELDFAKSVQKTGDLETAGQKLEAEIRANVHILREKLRKREDEFLQASMPVEELRLQQEAQVAEKLEHVLNFRDEVAHKMDKFNASLDLYKKFDVVMPPLNIQW